jgi:hypothetical protein
MNQRFPQFWTFHTMYSRFNFLSCPAIKNSLRKIQDFSSSSFFFRAIARNIPGYKKNSIFSVRFHFQDYFFFFLSVSSSTLGYSIFNYTFFFFWYDPSWSFLSLQSQAVSLSDLAGRILPNLFFFT